MHDATHYPWLRPGQQIGAHTVPSLAGPDGLPALWHAETPLDEAMAAPLGSALVAIDVYANHGRWIVECPDCHDAQLAVRDDRRYMCVECGNASVGGVWRPVNWPAEHGKIEALLDARPAQHTRNWAMGESVADLRAENRKHRVGA